MSKLHASDVFPVAAWAAIVFGLLEGIVLCLSRSDTLIQAAHKVSPAIIWVAPLVDLPLFLVAAVALLVAGRVLARWTNRFNLLFAFGFFLFLGLYTAISAPRKIHSGSAAVLALGVAVVICRVLRGREHGLAAWLRSRLVGLPAVVLAAALAVFAVGRLQEIAHARALPAAHAGDRNLLIIVLDTVRADRFAPFARQSLTPFLDQVAAQGVRFDNAWSTTSWSLPSQASILTGRYPHEHQADWPRIRLSQQYPTLAEFLTGRGYVTGAFSGNAAWVTPEYLGRGFLRFQVYRLEDLARRTVHGRKLDKLLEKVGYHSAGRGRKAPSINADFLQFLDDYPQRPFFVYLCYMDVNQAFHDRWLNYGDPDQVPKAEVVRAYDGSLRVLDGQIRELFGELNRRRLLANTIVVVTSDHGQSFGSKNPGDHDPAGHGTSLYREQTAVPLFAIAPGKVPAGGSVTSSVSIRQIPATVMHLLGISQSPFPGDPLSAFWGSEGKAPQPGATLLAELRDLDNRIIANSVISGEWQYLHHPNNLKEIKRGEELYNFAADPLEKTNLAAAPEVQFVLGRLRGELPQLRGGAIGASAPTTTDRHTSSNALE